MNAAGDPFGARLGLGVGIDLPWKGPYGFVDGRVAPRTRRFLDRYADGFAYLFVSWQARDRGRPRAADYFDAFDALFDGLRYPARALHQTALDLASPSYDRGPILELTNRLAERYGFRWVNEDLGLWSALGRPLPYPQPPPLTSQGIDCCTESCASAAAGLDVPLVVEFPGFEVPIPWIHGDLDAYDVFDAIVRGADVHCNLDTGHLLTWRWLAGYRGEDLLGDLDRLPLDRCVEIHCAGAVALDDRLIDAHHGVLLDLQLELAERLMARCGALRVVTYEDPRFDDDGVLPGPMAASVDALRNHVDAWLARVDPPPATPTRALLELRHATIAADPAPWERDLADRFLVDDELGRRLRTQLVDRETRGCGRLASMYPQAIARALAARDESTIDGLLRDFLCSADGRAWSEYAWAIGGRCIEDAFGRFVAADGHEHRMACARALTVDPDPPFVVPDGFSRAPGGWFALGGDDDLVLYAAVRGRMVTGPITRDIRDLLRGSVTETEPQVQAQLVALGLVG